MSHRFPLRCLNNPHPLCFSVKVKQEMKPSHAAARYYRPWSALYHRRQLQICNSTNRRLPFKTVHTWTAETLQIQFRQLRRIGSLSLTVASPLIHFSLMSLGIFFCFFCFTVRSPSSPATLRCRNDPSSPRGINKVHFICICWSFWVMLISAECRRRRLLSTVRKEGERTSFHWRLDLGGEK